MNTVYCYDTQNNLVDIRYFDTLESCFNFVSEQNKKYTKNVKIKNDKKLKKDYQLELNLF